MSTEVLGQHALPWTEDEYFALGETQDRIELFDGGLVVSPNPGGRHQHIARVLANVLEAPAHARGLEVVEAVNVRLRPGRVAIPDLIVTPDLDRTTFEAGEVALISEIVSPSNAVNDRVLKMHLYAEAGIPWYLLVEPTAGRQIGLRLYQLAGDRYVEHASAAGGETLRLTEPVDVRIVPADLLPRRA